jgi:hypothetical protein
LNKKFARRFVMGDGMIIRASHRYLRNTGAGRETHLLRDKALLFWEMKMRKTILTVFGAALIAVSAMQAAAAAQHHRTHKVVARAPVSTTEQFRNSNAAWPAPTVQGGAGDEALSPPAGH